MIYLDGHGRQVNAMSQTKACNRNVKLETQPTSLSAHLGNGRIRSLTVALEQC